MPKTRKINFNNIVINSRIITKKLQISWFQKLHNTHSYYGMIFFTLHFQF